MKALALITEKPFTDAAQWQFDKVMSAIAFDVDLAVVFIADGTFQFERDKSWKCLAIYGVENVFAYVKNDNNSRDNIMDITTINSEFLKVLIQQSDIII